jgi:hypothetical protein
MVIQIIFADALLHRRQFWLVHSGGVADVCLKSPGYETDLVVCTRVRVLAELWRGLRPLQSAIRGGDIRLTGHSALPGIPQLAVTERVREDQAGELAESSGIRLTIT